MFDQAVLITVITVDQPANINEETKRKITGRGFVCLFFVCFCFYFVCVCMKLVCIHACEYLHAHGISTHVDVRR